LARWRRHQQLLARFDPIGLYHYDIAAADLRDIERYIYILQAGLGETVWELAGVLADNLSAHVVAIYEEHRYLQGVLL
jgi:hypothetical protein